VRVNKQNDPGASYDALQWALDFMQQYEKKLLKRAINLAKINRYNSLKERMKLNGDE